MWELNWKDSFYKLLEVAYKEWKSDKDFLIDEAVKSWVNKTSLEKCFWEDKYLEKIQNQHKIGSKTFRVTWTPWNVLINNELRIWCYFLSLPNRKFYRNNW